MIIPFTHCDERGNKTVVIKMTRKQLVFNILITLKIFLKTPEEGVCTAKGPVYWIKKEKAESVFKIILFISIQCINLYFLLWHHSRKHRLRLKTQGG